MATAYPLSVGGLTRFSTIDYPGHVSAVVFCQGCPWRCTYCHNTDLQPRDCEMAIPWREITDWLDNRHGLLEAVVFSGGEPLLQRGLAWAMHEVRQMGYRVALHTAGIYPERLAGVLPLVNWIGFDVKAPFPDYPRITQARDRHNGSGIRRALSFVLASGKPYEVRCTVNESALDTSDAERMAQQIADMGVSHLVLQARRDPAGRSSPISAAFVGAMQPWIPHLELRTA
ncbi:MAG: anaerobic ribonucleoside-triphosphate reductase activating protein [Propionivibrio sp.]